MKTVADLKVGDKVWVGDVNARGRPHSEGTILKLGTKLITVGHRVFRKDTLRINDNCNHQWLILDLKAEQERLLRLEYLREISDQVRYSKAELENVRIAAAMLGIKLKEPNNG